MVFTVLVIVSLFLMIMAIVRDWYEIEGYIAFFVIVLVLGAISIGIFNSQQVGHVIQIKKLHQYEANYQDQVDNVLVQVRAELAKYPTYEEKVISKVTPKAGDGTITIVIPPILKSNETIIESAKMIAKYNDSIYQTRLQILDERAAIEINNRVGRWWVPFIYRPTAAETN